SRADTLLRRAISGDGVRSTDVPGEPARYRDLFVGTGVEAVSHGFSRTGSALNAGRRQRIARLRIYAELAQRLIAQAKKLYVTEDLGLDSTNTVYALDATTIKLCLSVFPWAHFRTTKAAVRCTSCWICAATFEAKSISDGKLGDVHALDLLIPEPGAIYVMHRGSVDFARLHALHHAGAFFVTRTKSNMNAHRSIPALSATNPLPLDGHYTSQHDSEHLRRIRFKDAEMGKTLVFLTNPFALPALTTATLDKNRWQVELFFKWIKQHLRIK
ncbi:MAG: transposase, partial [Rhodospirillales bacterium]|nr:transposase [Rhodospirillales bacterium]